MKAFSIILFLIFFSAKGFSQISPKEEKKPTLEQKISAIEQRINKYNTLVVNSKKNETQNEKDLEANIKLLADHKESIEHTIREELITQSIEENKLSLLIKTITPFDPKMAENIAKSFNIQ